MDNPVKRVKKQQFRKVFTLGKSVSSPHLSFRSVKISSPSQHVSVVVSTRIAPKAVVRNRLRRTVREAVRAVLPPSQVGFYGVISIRSSVLPVQNEIKKEVLFLLEKSGMLV